MNLSGFLFLLNDSIECVHICMCVYVCKMCIPDKKNADEKQNGCLEKIDTYIFRSFSNEIKNISAKMLMFIMSIVVALPFD